MNKIRIAVGALLLLFTSAAPGERPRPQVGQEKPAWEWTEEERVAARLNPQWQEESRQRAIARGQSVPEGVTIIHGSLEPELFLPAELFDLFISTVFTDNLDARISWRQGISRRYSGRLPVDFWERLEHVTRELRDGMKRDRELGQELSSTEEAERQRVLVRLDLVRAENCALSKEALRRARSLLSAREFDRLLYEAVAPNLVAARPAASEWLLPALDRGC